MKNSSVYEKLVKAAQNPAVKQNLNEMQDHFEKYGNGPISEDVYMALPGHMQVLYEQQVEAVQ